MLTLDSWLILYLQLARPLANGHENSSHIEFDRIFTLIKQTNRQGNEPFNNLELILAREDTSSNV